MAGREWPKQPFHAAEEMALAEAQAFITNAKRGAVSMAAVVVKGTVRKLRDEGYLVERAAVLVGSGKPLPELAKILSAHPLIHTAEGVFFRDVLKQACELSGLAVLGIPERDLLPKISTGTLAAMGKALGRPWTRDEKLSAAAALEILRYA
jgi:hypothetical protein